METIALPHEHNAEDTCVPLNEAPPLLCCCSIVNEALSSQQHLDDCELNFYNGVTFGEDSSDDSIHSESRIKKRKHRESMARQRQKLRESVHELTNQERELAQELQRVIEQFQSVQCSSAEDNVSVRQAYFELVKEQLKLQHEKRDLQRTWIEKDKYERLVQRQICRMDDAAQDISDETQ